MPDRTATERIAERIVDRLMRDLKYNRAGFDLCVEDDTLMEWRDDWIRLVSAEIPVAVPRARHKPWRKDPAATQMPDLPIADEEAVEASFREQAIETAARIRFLNERAEAFEAVLPLIAQALRGEASRLTALGERHVGVRHAAAFVEGLCDAAAVTTALNQGQD
jgi:hypothetical protein